MRQIAEELVAERIITKVLDCAAAVSESMRPLQPRFGGMRKAPKQEGPDGALPVQVDELLVCLNRIRERVLTGCYNKS